VSSDGTRPCFLFYRPVHGGSFSVGTQEQVKDHSIAILCRSLVALLDATYFARWDPAYTCRLTCFPFYRPNHGECFSVGTQEQANDHSILRLFEILLFDCSFSHYRFRPMEPGLRVQTCFSFYRPVHNGLCFLMARKHRQRILLNATCFARWDPVYAHRPVSPSTDQFMVDCFLSARECLRSRSLIVVARRYLFRSMGPGLHM
jgi:hypothetical protein